jgi:post-segregation antitoxin (ccd killing protein)
VPKKTHTSIVIEEALLAKYRRERKRLGLNLSAIASEALEKAISERRRLVSQSDLAASKGAGRE